MACYKKRGPRENFKFLHFHFLEVYSARMCCVFNEETCITRLAGAEGERKRSKKGEQQRQFSVRFKIHYNKHSLTLSTPLRPHRARSESEA